MPDVSPDRLGGLNGDSRDSVVPDEPAAACAPVPVDPPPSVPRMLGRGLRGRCPRCGSGRVFATWFRLAEHCPSCRLRLERESDFFLGAYVINLAVTEGLLAVVLFAYVLWASTHPGAPLRPAVVAGLVVAVAAPALFFPVSRTLWAAIDLAMRPVPADDDGREHRSRNSPDDEEHGPPRPPS